MKWGAVSERILYPRFESKQIKLSMIVCYAPTEQDDEENKITFYEALERTLSVRSII